MADSLPSPRRMKMSSSNQPGTNGILKVPLTVSIEPNQRVKQQEAKKNSDVNIPFNLHERVKEKWKEIEELLKEKGCYQCELEDQIDKECTTSVTLLLAFTKLESLNKFKGAVRAWAISKGVTLAKEYFLPHTLHQILLGEILGGENWNVVLKQEDLDALTDKVNFFKFVESPLHLRDDLSDDAKQKDVNWKLWVSVKQGNHHRVQECLDHGADVNYYGDGNIGLSTALHEAVATNNLEICKVLLSASGININLKMKKKPVGLHNYVNPRRQANNYNQQNTALNNQRFGQTALYSATSQEMCNLLLENGARVDVVDEAGWTPLQYAVDTGYSGSVVDSLLKAMKKDKLDLDRKYPDGSTLYTACFKHINEDESLDGNGPDDIVAALAKAKVDIELPGKNGLTPLLEAVSAMNIKMTKLLLHYGANIHATDTDGNSVFHHIMMTFSKGSSPGSSSLLLQSKTVTTSSRVKEWQHTFEDPGGMIRRPAMKFDWFYVTIHLLLELINCDGDVTAVNKNGDSPLHIAARCGLGTTCEFLINYGANVNIANNEGNTPLHVARGGTWHCLLKSGAAPLAVNSRWETPLHLAVKTPNDQTFDFIQALLEGNACINAKDIDQLTPLHAALKTRHVDNAYRLILAGANVHECDKDGSTILHYASEKNMEYVRIHKRDDSYSSDSYYNPYTGQQNTSILAVLLDLRGIQLQTGQFESDVNATDKDGNTPLHLAAHQNADVNCLMLLQAGADALIVNKDGAQPFDGRKYLSPELRQHLEKQRKDALVLAGEMKLNKTKLFLIGEPQAGKTTLKETLSQQAEMRKIGGLQQPAGMRRNRGISQQSRISKYVPTAGIDLSLTTIGKADTRFLIWDYAGHEEYHVTHSLFLGGDNAIFLVAYDLSRLMDKDHEKAKEYYNKLKHWLCFVKAANSTAKPMKPKVLLVGTHLDNTEGEGMEYAEQNLERLKQVFDTFLDISHCPIAVDTRLQNSEGMTMLISELERLQKKMTEGVKVPSLCEKIKEDMRGWPRNESMYPVLPKTEFHAQVRKNHPNVTPLLLQTAAGYLHQMGDIYIAMQPTTEKQLVVLEPQWLCKEVIAPAFARSKHFNPRALEDQEEYTDEDFRRLFPKFSNPPSLLIFFLEQLDLIYKVTVNRYVMPVKLKAKKDRLWKEDASMTEYYGRRVECHDETDIFSADVFPCLQVAMMKKFLSPQEKPVICLNGLKISQTVEGYIEMTPDMRAIQYYVRGRGEVQRDRCYAMLKDIETMIDDELEDRSPGTQVTKKYLSSTEVKKHQDTDKVRSYTIDQVMEAVQGDGIVHEQGTHNTDEVASMVCKGYDMVFLEKCGVDCKLEWAMTKEAKDHLAEVLDKESCKRDDYRSLAEAFGIADSRLEQLEKRLPQGSSITSAVLDEWCKDPSHTVGELLQMLTIPGLVDNEKARRILTDLIARAGQHTQDHSNASTDCVTGLSVEVLAHRAALRRESDMLLRNAQADIVWDHVQHCFPEQTATKLEHDLKNKDVVSQMEIVITELLKLKESTWWEPLLKGVSSQSQDKQATRFIAQQLQEAYVRVVSEHTIFTPLKSSN